MAECLGEVPLTVVHPAQVSRRHSQEQVADTEVRIQLHGACGILSRFVKPAG